MDLEQWKEYERRSRDWTIRMKYELLHSTAYRDLNYAPAIKVLNWFHEKIKVEKIEGRRGKQRYRVKDGGEMSFTYKEAVHRGLTHQKFRKAIRELHRLGFVDVVRPGSSMKGDWTVFKLSASGRHTDTAFRRGRVPEVCLLHQFRLSGKEPKAMQRGRRKKS